MMTQKEFGLYVRDFMDAHGISRKHVAEQMGWKSRQLVYKRLLGEGWTLDEAMKIIKVLNLPEDVLIK